ncbi:MAG: hypothetical protein LBC71_07595 [Oscillospiraceae bacterium]|jgi:hypothetical protein|nr:hypothetical protein [Oscillospiraceae bacterium]
MRRFLVLLFILTLFMLVACNDSDDSTSDVSPTPVVTDGTNGNDNPNTDNPNNGDIKNTDDPNIDDTPLFSLSVGDFVVEMNMNVEYALAALGEPLGVFEAPSCAFDGVDRIFQYQNFQLLTYPIGDDDFIHTISFRNDLIRTTEGIRIGSSINDVLQAYGDEYEYDLGLYRFIRDRTSIEFLIENDIVVQIIYGYTINNQ